MCANFFKWFKESVWKSDIIKNNMEESDLTCPICSAKLYIEESLVIVDDGNTVYHCEKDNKHVFFSSSWDCEEILYLNTVADETSFNYDKSFKLIDNKWIEIFLND